MSEAFLSYGTDHSVNGVCSLCQKTLSSDTDATGDLESIGICGDCKFLFLEELDTPSREPSRIRRRRRTATRRRGTTGHSSTESAENLFSQQFSHMISLVRQNQPTAVSGPEDPPAARATPAGSGRWRRVYSDTESDDAESVVSLQAVSFTSYGSGSDDDDEEASVDLDGSDFDTVTDAADNIDPMHAGLDHWNSDDDDDEWEEVEAEQQPDADGGTRRTRNFLFSNWEDHLDSGGLEEFLRRLAADEDDNEVAIRGGGGGAPPASASFVKSLPRVVVEEGGGGGGGDLTCAICKEALAGGGEASRLPCNHLYHTACISPWLSSRNSCPLCRYELPTDDRDYENGKHPIADEDSSVTFSDREDGGEDETGVSGPPSSAATAATAGEGGRGGGRWLFLAAAPIVGLLGIVLVLWLGDIGAEGRHDGDGTQVQRDVQVIGSSGGGERESRSRRWWSFF